MLTIAAGICLAALVAVAWAQTRRSTGEKSTSAADLLRSTGEKSASAAGQPGADTLFRASSGEPARARAVALPETDGSVVNMPGGTGGPGGGHDVRIFTFPPAYAPRLEAGQGANELLGKWKAAGNEADRDKLRKQLHEVLKADFQVRLAAHEKEIEQLEGKVKQLRQQLELRRQKQDEIVDFRCQQLIREAQGLGWGTEPATGPFPPSSGLAPGITRTEKSQQSRAAAAPFLFDAGRPAKSGDQSPDRFAAPPSGVGNP
jgi:hypothetical protein